MWLVATLPSGIRILGVCRERRLAQGIRVLVNALVEGDLVKGVEEDADVQPGIEIADVAQVVADALAEGEVVAPEDLGEPADAGAHTHAVHLRITGEGVHLFWHPGARADEGHVPLEHVEKLWQLIQRAGAQHLAHPGGALLIRQKFAICPALIGHGAEFDDVEGLAVAPNAALHVDGVATLCAAEQEGDEQEQGGEQQQHEQRRAEVDRAFQVTRIQRCRSAAQEGGKAVRAHGRSLVREKSSVAWASVPHQE